MQLLFSLKKIQSVPATGKDWIRFELPRSAYFCILELRECICYLGMMLMCAFVKIKKTFNVFL